MAEGMIIVSQEQDISFVRKFYQQLGEESFF
jgi:hypothetical protein